MTASNSCYDLTELFVSTGVTVAVIYDIEIKWINAIPSLRVMTQQPYHKVVPILLLNN